MVMFEDTPFETTVESNEDMLAFILLGCGFVVIRSSAAQQRATELSYKVRTIRNRMVGFSFFTYQV